MVSFDDKKIDTRSKRYHPLLSYMEQLEDLMEKDSDIFHQNNIEHTRIHVNKKEEISTAYRHELALLLKSPDTVFLTPEDKNLFKKAFYQFTHKLKDNLVLLNVHEQVLNQRIDSHYSLLKEEHTRSSAFYNRHGKSSQVLKSVQLSKKI